MTEDSRYIRCNLKPEDAKAAMPYLIRMEITKTSNEPKSKLEAALPQFYKPSIEYSYFYVNISRFNGVQLVEYNLKQVDNPVFGKIPLIVICVSVFIIVIIIFVFLIKMVIYSRWL